MSGSPDVGSIFSVFFFFWRREVGRKEKLDPVFVNNDYDEFASLVPHHQSLTLTSVSVDFAVIVLDQLFYESTVLVQDLVSHVGDVMEHRLILHLMQQHYTDEVTTVQLLQLHTKILLSAFSTLTMKFCCRGDHEYMTGTEATALRVFSGMTCRGNSEKPLSTVHCGAKERSEHVLHPSVHWWKMFTCSPLGFLSESRRTSWCELAGFAWSSTPGSECPSGRWFSDGWCWTFSGRFTRKFSLIYFSSTTVYFWSFGAGFQSTTSSPSGQFNTISCAFI